MLAVFETAAGAVTAALGIQQALQASTNAVPENNRMRFRIGVHLGDVIEKTDGTVYGDGVNISARLQALGRTRRGNGVGHGARRRTRPGLSKL